jgi:hypothetical protein
MIIAVDVNVRVVVEKKTGDVDVTFVAGPADCGPIALLEREIVI